MKVLVVEPGYLPYEEEIDGLSDMKGIVGGALEAIYPFKDDIALVCNPEGRNLSMEFNRSIPERSYGGIFGPFFICGLEGEHFVSLPPEYMPACKERFKEAEILVTMLGDKPVVLPVDAMKKRDPHRPIRPPKPKRR